MSAAATIDVSLTTRGARWVASWKAETWSAPSLDALDAAVRARFAGRDEVRHVRMCFDRTALPEAVRQYAPHYFDRVIEV